MPCGRMGVAEVIKSYDALILLDTIEDRYKYLRIGGGVGYETFGFDRYLNQGFYQSTEWKRVRNEVISRDNGCDLGLEGYEINGRILIHHMNPIRPSQIKFFDPDILNPDFLISCSHKMHNAIHYGDENLLPRRIVERRPNDTIPWRQ
nr:MAG TPA: HNH endonuclease bacteriophage, HNH Endonuclease, DNA.52A [Caudoviricetes sp.]